MPHTHTNETTTTKPSEITTIPEMTLTSDANAFAFDAECERVSASDERMEQRRQYVIYHFPEKGRGVGELAGCEQTNSGAQPANG